MKDKKILFTGGIILLLVLGIILYFVVSGTDKNNFSGDEGVGDKIVAPANNTEELVKEMQVIEIESINEDEIVFSNDIELKEKEKVAVWIYSEPKFLGYFEVLVEDGIKKIVGLKEAIEKITIEDGKHNIAITTESGKPLGYVDVSIENNGTLAENYVEEKDDIVEKEETMENKEEKIVIKEVKVNETVAYSSTKQNEQNMKNGTTVVAQVGVNGTKEVTYEVTYDVSGKEMSRKKVSEKVIKEPVNEIIKVGTSDFNINTDKITGSMAGPYCTEDKTYYAPFDGLLYCNDELYTDLKQFGATMLGDKIIVTRLDTTKLSTAIIATPVNDFVYSATYNGQKYYFDNRMGSGEQETLTLEFCNEYGLKCGTW